MMYYEICSLNDVRHRYNCSINGTYKCFASLIIGDGKIDCENEKNENQPNYVHTYVLPVSKRLKKH
jgi:hypothetical protein